MSFGFSVGDFISLGKLAFDTYKQCQGCSGQYRELSNDAGQLALTLSSLEDLIKQDRIDVQNRAQLLQHGQACKQVLLDIQEVLQKYESLSSKSKRIHDMLGWDYEGARELRDRLTATVVMLSTFYQTLTTSAIYRLEDAMARMLRQVQQGQKSADSISIISSLSEGSATTPAAWRQVISDLEDLGISANDVEQHRDFIVKWFADALQAIGVPSTNVAGKKVSIAKQPEALPQSSQSHQLYTGLLVAGQVAQSSRKVFGVSLSELWTNEGGACPSVVTLCVKVIDLYGLNSEGIYNAPGSIARMNNLRRQIEKAPEGLEFRDPAAFKADVFTVASLLKLFLRELPQPLTFRADNQVWMEAAQVEPEIVRLGTIRSLVGTLPEPNYETLKTIILHLSRVAENSQINRMDAGNLGIVFAPTLFGTKFGDLRSSWLGIQGWINIVRAMIEHSVTIFS